MNLVLAAAANPTTAKTRSKLRMNGWRVNGSAPRSN